MADTPAPAQPSEQPVFHVQRLYLKDLSFESPNVPQLFSQQHSEPQIALNLDSKTAKLDEENYEVALHVTVKTTVGEQVMFLVEVSYAGIFLIRNVPPAHLPMLIGIECPTILFPYIRQVISQAVVDGGFRPLVLDPINFQALFQQAQAKAAKERGGSTVQ